MGGTSIVESRIARWTTNFNTLSSDNRILYENGAEKIALEAAKHLSNAMKNVETKQYGKFKKPVQSTFLQVRQVFLNSQVSLIKQGELQLAMKSTCLVYC